MILSLKVSYAVVESLNSSHETELCCEIDFEDTETDEKSELDEEESKHFYQTAIFNTISITSKNTLNHFIFSDLYRIQYLEFTTPPPQVA